MNTRVAAGTTQSLLTTLAILGVISIGLFAASKDVSAHAEPNEIRPGDGARVTTVPTRVEIVMSQELARREAANDIDVIGPDGAEVTTEPAALDMEDRRRLSVPLPSDLEPGTYTVRWKSLSAEDGDPEEGELSFTYDPTGQPSPGREQLDDDLPGSVAGTPEATVSLGPLTDGNDSPGGTWVVAAAAGIAGLAIGGAATFLLVNRRPRAVA